MMFIQKYLKAIKENNKFVADIGKILENAILLQANQVIFVFPKDYVKVSAQEKS